MPPRDLAAVDELCRLVLVARRLGCTVTFTEVPDELRTLLDLAGVTELFDDEHDLDLNETDLR